jgi:stage V sporulation protein SpoVS
VVHVGQSAVILVAATPAADDLLALTSRRRGLVPGGVCLQEGDFGSLTRALAGSPIRVDLADWQSITTIDEVDLRLAPVDVDPCALEQLCDLLAAEPNGDSGAPLDPRPVRALATPLTRAALDGDAAATAVALGRLVGAGPGATPTGDDVIVGVLAALDATTSARPAAARARQQLATRLPLLLHRTTRIARHDLAAALAGEFSEHVHATVAALTDPAAVPAAVAAARTWGATSGIDLACGLAAALSCLGTTRSGRPPAPSPRIPSTTEQRGSS